MSQYGRHVSGSDRRSASYKSDFLPMSEYTAVSSKLCLRMEDSKQEQVKESTIMEMFGQVCIGQPYLTSGNNQETDQVLVGKVCCSIRMQTVVWTKEG